MTPLTFWHSLGGQPATVLEQIVEDYNKTHEQTVQLVAVDPKNYASAANEALNKPPEERPHLLLAPEYLTGKMNQALKDRVALSVNSLLNPDQLADIAEIVSRTFGTDCLPFNPACGVLYINDSLLVASGFAPNWQPSSIEELVAAATTIREKTKTPNGYTCAWPESYLIETVLAQQNLSLLTPAGDYNFTQLTEHLLYLRGLVQEGVFLPPNTGNYDPTRDLFTSGQVAFYMQGSTHASAIEGKASEAGFEVRVAPLPMLSKGQTEKFAFPLGGAAIWALNTTSDTTEGSLPVESMVKGVREFLNYLASKQIQAAWHKATAYVPVSKSVRATLGEGFYQTHPLHAAVISQTIEAPLGENSFGTKRQDYSTVRPKLYPLIRELLLLEGNADVVRETIKSRLEGFEKACNHP